MIPGASLGVLHRFSLTLTIEMPKPKKASHSEDYEKPRYDWRIDGEWLHWKVASYDAGLAGTLRANGNWTERSIRLSSIQDISLGTMFLDTSRDEPDISFDINETPTHVVLSVKDKSAEEAYAQFFYEIGECEVARMLRNAISGDAKAPKSEKDALSKL